MQNDLTFFTNEPCSTLLDRFKRTLRNVKLFDILVGYFRTSSFDKLHDSFSAINKIRILGTTRYDFLFIDEAHRFRNEVTQEYGKLHQICFGKKVIPVSATPRTRPANPCRPSRLNRTATEIRNRHFSL